MSVYMKKLELLDISKSFFQSNCKIDVLNKINFTINDGEMMCILGPNGCGKTTLIKIAAGILMPDEGQVLHNQELVQEPNWNRTVIFQELHLFPWMTTLENVMFGLKAKGLSKEKQSRLAKEQLKMFGIENFSQYYPNQLSLGTKQKVAIARAFAVKPDVLLLDEPFSSLDMQSREQFQQEIRNVAKKQKQTILFVTHSIDEALFLGDKILVLSESPANIKEIVELNKSQERNYGYRHTENFFNLKKEISGVLRKGEGL